MLRTQLVDSIRTKNPPFLSLFIVGKREILSVKTAKLAFYSCSNDQHVNLALSKLFVLYSVSCSDEGLTFETSALYSSYGDD